MTAAREALDVVVGGPPVRRFSLLGKRDARDPRELPVAALFAAALANARHRVVRPRETCRRSSRSDQLAVLDRRRPHRTVCCVTGHFVTQL